MRTQETGNNTPENPDRPDLKGYDVDYTGNRAHPDGGLPWLVRVYGDSATLDALASETGVTELSDVPADALNKMLGQDRNDTGWNDGFRVE